jgi:uncharacterized protein (TIGR03437 family)
LGFTAAANPSVSWLNINPASGTTTSTPQALSVSILTAGLTAQTYHTSIVLTAAGSGISPAPVPVTLTVNSEPSLAVTPTSLSFSYLTGGTAPTPQSVSVSTSNQANTAFSVSATSSGNWLQVSPTSGQTTGLGQGSFLASIVPGNLTAGTYTGTINVSATGFISPSPLTVTLTITQPKAVILITGNAVFSLANSAPPATSTLAISASDGSAQAFTIAAGPSQYTWLTLSPVSGTTPANVTLTANAAGLAPGLYTTAITVTMPGLPIPTKTITAVLTVPGSNLAASPNMLTYSYQPGGPLPATQTISLTTASGVGSVALTSVTTSAQWLQVSTSAYSTPATLKVSANPGLLSPGTYYAAVLVQAVGSPSTSLEIPASITVSAAPQLTVAPAALTFTYQIGAAAAPGAQSIAVASGNTPLTFSVTAAPSTWLQASPTSGTTPASVNVTVNPAGLAAGTYGGTITVTGSGTNSGTVAVTLTVTAAPGLLVAPSKLTFTAPVGGPAPAPQTLTVTSTTAAALGFTAGSMSPWLSVTPASGTTPATLAVSVNLTGLTQGTYSGSIGIQQTGAQVVGVIPVTLQVGAVSALTITGVINAASGVPGLVAPGMAISIFGTALGPQTPATFVLPAAGGSIATTLAGTEVLFDGTAVPILYTSSTQVNALAPFELAGKASTVVSVTYNGNTSSNEFPVEAAIPGLFTANATGKGEGAILNQDGSVNSASKPAAAGSVIQLFGTGAGLTDPASVDGTLNPIPPPLGALVATTTATVGGESAVVYYSGPAPGLLAGIFQVDVTLPADTPAGNIPVVVTLTCATPGSANCFTASTQAAVTVVVQ